MNLKNFLMTGAARRCERVGLSAGEMKRRKFILEGERELL